jgi:hypothetical protein
MSRFNTDPDKVLRISKETLDHKISDAIEAGFLLAVKALKNNDAFKVHEEVSQDMTPFSWAEWLEDKKAEILR